MRSLFRLALPGALTLAITAAIAVAALPAGPALAQDAGKPAPSKGSTPAKPGKTKTLQGSPMAQVPFSEPAYPLTDDGTYRDYLARIINEFGRRCVRQEQFGWELAKGDQKHLDHIFQGTLSSFEKAGYLVGPVKPKTIADPETVAYLADRNKRRLLMVWVPMDTSLLLMMCDTDAVAPRKQ